MLVASDSRKIRVLVSIDVGFKLIAQCQKAGKIKILRYSGKRNRRTMRSFNPS